MSACLSFTHLLSPSLRDVTFSWSKAQHCSFAISQHFYIFFRRYVYKKVIINQIKKIKRFWGIKTVFDFWISDFSNIESWFSQNKSKLFAKQSRNSVFLISINLQLSIPALFCIRHRSKRAMSAFEVSNFLFTLWNRWTKSCENCQIFEWSNSRGELRYFLHGDIMS